MIQSCRDLLQRCVHDLNIIDRRLYGLQDAAMHIATRTGIVSLTRREQHILTLVGDNLSNPEIGRALNIRPEPSKTPDHIMSKLFVNDRRQAVARAQALGII